MRYTKQLFMPNASEAVWHPTWANPEAIEEGAGGTAVCRMRWTFPGTLATSDREFVTVSLSVGGDDGSHVVAAHSVVRPGVAASAGALSGSWALSVFVLTRTQVPSRACSGHLEW